MKNYSKASIAERSRVELHNTFKLSWAEISINILPCGISVPFMHSHK